MSLGKDDDVGDSGNVDDVGMLTILTMLTMLGMASLVALCVQAPIYSAPMGGGGGRGISHQI